MSISLKPTADRKNISFTYLLQIWPQKKQTGKTSNDCLAPF